MTPAEFDEWQARDAVIPLDHTEKMLGWIAYMMSRYLGYDDMEEVCMPWIDNSPLAQTRRATGGL